MKKTPKSEKPRRSGRQGGATRREVAARLKIPVAEVAKIERTALLKLRRRLAERGLNFQKLLELLKS